VAGRILPAPRHRPRRDQFIVFRSAIVLYFRGVERADDRRVICGIVHVLKSGCRCDCPPEYGPSTTIYNRFVRWARRGIWENLFSGNWPGVDDRRIRR
jgi:transposase